MSDYLIHSGIKGQKWGIRRYQNEDGTLTEAGKRRYNIGLKRLDNRIDHYDKQVSGTQYSMSERKRVNAVNLYARKNTALQTKEERDSVVNVGKHTLSQRIGIAASSGLATAGAAFATAALDSAIPLIAIPATAIAAGVAYYKTKI